MIAIDAEHLKKWILARWLDNGGKDNDAPTAEEILDQIDREIRFMSLILEGPHWTPVSERLPEEDEDVLITNEDGGVDVAHYSFNSWTDEPLAEWWCGCGEYRVYPIAWMPLPEPYKEA